MSHAGRAAYRPDIDGLRAVAVLIVVLFHAFPALLRGGFVGVDIFFVISGYLISKIIITGVSTGEFSFTEFYVRRIKRIFPALILVMAASLAFGWFALFADEFQMLAKHVLGGSSFISNFLLWFEVGYFDTAAETKPLLHLWSLGIEEQFYIFWPIILILAHRFGTRALQVALLIAAVSLLINVGGVSRFPSATFYSIASRAWELLLGGIVAMLSLNKFSFSFGEWRYAPTTGPALPVSGPIFDTATTAGRDVVSVLGMGFLIAACSLVKKGQGFPGWWALLPALGAAMIIAAGPQAWFNRVVLSSRLLVWVGLLSYPLYLWHWPLLAFARIVESGEPSRNIRIAAVLAAFVLAWLTFRLVELPLRNRQGGSGKTALGLLVAMLLLAGCAGWIYKGQGLPTRSSVVQNASLQKGLILVEDRDNAAACKKRYGFTTLWEYCLIGQVDKPPTVALIGDSHAYHVVAGLTKYYADQGENLVYWGTRRPFFGIVPEPNDKFQEATPQMLELALTTPSVKTVIISTIVKMDDSNEAGKLLIRQFRDTLQKYVSAGKQVVYIYDVPELDFDPRACISRAGIPSSKTKIDCSMARADFDKSVVRHNAITAAVLAEFPMVMTFSTAKYLCDAARCHGMIDKKLMYRDTHHLTYDGDLYIGQKYAAERAASALHAQR